MKTYRLLPILLSAGALVAGSFNLNAASSGVVGAVSVEIPVGNVALAPVFVHPDDFVGQIASLSEDSTTTEVVLNGASFGGDEFDSAAYPLYYLEVVEAGPNQGYVFDITSTTVNSVVVEGLLATDFSISENSQVAIRKHFTIADLFSDASGLTEFDSVTFYDDSGVPFGFFKVGSIWSSDFGVTDDSNKPIYPGSGIVTALQNAVTLTIFGTVKATATKVPLYANVVNINSAINPVDSSISGLGLESALGDFEPITTYAFDGSFSSPLAYFNVPGVGLSSDFSTETTDTANGLNAFVTTVGADGYWTAPAAYVP